MATKLKTKRLNIQGAMTPGKVLAIVDDDTMEAVENGGGGGGGISPSFNIEETLVNFYAAENILLGQYCCKKLYTPINLLVNTDDVLSFRRAAYDPPLNISFGQCVRWSVNNGNMNTLQLTFNGYTDNGSNGSYIISLTAKIYAISGVYGTTAIPTGLPLYVSDTVVQSWGYTYGNIVTKTMLFTINQNIPQGDYVVMFEGTETFSSNVGGGGAFVRGDSAGAAYLGNVVDGTTPLAGQNLYIQQTGTTYAAYVADAKYTEKSLRGGQATNNALEGELVGLKKYGECSQTGASNDGANRYLSNTPGELSLTEGTNVRLIGQGSGTDKVWAGRTQYKPSIDILHDNTVYYTNTEGLLSAGFNITYGGLAPSTALSIEISDDNTTRIMLMYEQGGGGYDSSGTSRFRECNIPAGKYFRVNFNAGGGTITTHFCKLYPIK